jgi:hypothetical protein
MSFGQHMDDIRPEHCRRAGPPMAAMTVDQVPPLTLVRNAIREPGVYVDQLTSYPRHCRAMEPLDRWQARAVIKALTGVGILYDDKEGSGGREGPAAAVERDE